MAAILLVQARKSRFDYEGDGRK